MAGSITVVRAKWGRAREHLKEFEFERVRWVEHEAMTVRREREEGTINVWRVGKVTRPKNMALVIGDFLTNSMAVLDYIAFAVCDGITKTPKEQKRIFFPLLNSRIDYRQKFRTDSRYQTVKCWAKPGAMTLFEASQPYKRATIPPGANPTLFKRKSPQHHPLKWLDTLVNIDKHRYPHVTAGGISGYYFTKPVETRMQILYRLPWDTFCPLVPGTELLRIRFANEADAAMAVHLKFLPDVFFDDPQLTGTPLYGLRVQYVLGSIMTCLFNEVIPRFRPLL